MLRQDRDGATAILTLDYPERRNALAMAMRAAMVDALEEAGQRGRRPKALSSLMLMTRRRYESDQQVLASIQIYATA